MINNKNNSKFELDFVHILIALLFSLITTLAYEKTFLVSIQLLALTFTGLLICKYSTTFKLLIGYIGIIPVLTTLASLLTTKSYYLYSTYIALDKLNIGFTLQSTRLIFLITIILLMFLTLATKDKNYITIPAFLKNILVVSSFLAPIILLIIG